MFSDKAEIERAINVYRQPVESQQGAGPFAMLKSPGLRPQMQPSGGNAVWRGGFELNGQVLAVVNDKVYNLDSPTHVHFTYGMSIFNDLKPVRMAASAVSCCITTGGILYRLNGGNITTPTIPAPFIDIVFINTYFVGITNGTAAYWSSDDGVTWDPADIFTAEADANSLVAAIVHQEVLYLYGNRVYQPFVVGSNANDPFNLQESGVSPFGIEAQNTLVTAGLYRYWLMQNREGGGQVYRASGYGGQRISNLFVENKIRQYEAKFGTSDAIGMSFILNGQEFYRLVFPSADASLEFNASLGEWEEVAAWDFQNAVYHRHRANMIVSAFDKILVGDYANGWLYELTPDEYTDFGFPLRWLRRAPHIVNMGHKIEYDELRLGIESGVGLSPPLWLQSYSMQRAAFVTALANQVSLGNVTPAQSTVLQNIYDFKPYTPLNPYPSPDTMNTLGFVPWGGPAVLNNGTVLGAPPTIQQSYSRNAGKNFSQDRSRSLGMPGDDMEVYWTRNGSSRDQVFQLWGSDPVKYALTTSFLDFTELAS